MSTRELERVEIMGRVSSRELKLQDAAAMLQVSYRQVKRLWRRYREVGSRGLQHGNAGRASHRSKPAKFRRQVLRLIQQKYSGSEKERFGPTLAAEHLAEEDGMVINHETLRRWMLAEGLWSRQRKRKKHSSRAKRRLCSGSDSLHPPTCARPIKALTLFGNRPRIPLQPRRALGEITRSQRLAI